MKCFLGIRIISLIFCRLLSLSLIRQTIESIQTSTLPKFIKASHIETIQRIQSLLQWFIYLRRNLKVNKFFFYLLNFHLDYVISSSIFAEISLTLSLLLILDYFKLCKFNNKFFWILSCSSKFCLSSQKKIRYSSCCWTLFY